MSLCLVNVFRSQVLRIAFTSTVVIVGTSEFTEAQTSATPATIESVSTTGTHVEFSNGEKEAKASIGRWDTPYPHPETGERAPGLEPEGVSSFIVNIAVGAGGTVSFSYNLKTYDAGLYDWFDADLITPDGTRSIVSKLGKPGSDYGTFWTSPTVDVPEIDLSPWINQSVKLVFSVRNDGWGDQTQGNITNLQISPGCSVLPLAPLTDPDAIKFENGVSPDPSDLLPALQTGYSCLTSAISGAGGSYTLNSAFRPPAYQTHFLEVWSKWQVLKNDKTQQCAQRKAEVEAEIDRHKIRNLNIAPAGPSGSHTQRAAFDLTWDLPPSSNIDALAEKCNLKRRMPTRDPVHFELR